jgi:bacterioferritin-associated ferredoxin
MTATCTPEACQQCSHRVVCRCLQVTEDRIVDAIQTLALRSVRDIRRATGAGDGCTCCHQELRQLLDQHA